MMTITDTVAAYGSFPLRKRPARAINIINFEFIIAGMPVPGLGHLLP
jgi:hypothetical protein